MTEQKTEQVQKKGLGIFERYLTLWVGLCIVGGIVLGTRTTQTTVVCWRKKRRAVDVDYGD